MPDFETLLVPLDGSPTAEASLSHARWLARGLDAQLVLFESALARTLPGLPNATPSETISSAERYLEPLEASIRAEGIRCRSVVAYGPAAESILDNAELQRADLVVISARGQQDSVHWAQGDVAGKVVCGLRAPTLVVQEPHRSASCILAPLDGSSQAESALAPVGELAGRMRLQVVLLAVSPVGADRARAAEYLRRAAERLRQRGVSTATEVRVGDPAREIVEMARATGSSMIALSTSSRSDPEDRSFGTIADRVLHEAHQPVLLLRPPAVEQTVRSVRASAVLPQLRTGDLPARACPGRPLPSLRLRAPLLRELRQLRRDHLPDGQPLESRLHRHELRRLPLPKNARRREACRIAAARPHPRSKRGESLTMGLLPRGTPASICRDGGIPAPKLGQSTLPA